MACTKQTARMSMDPKHAHIMYMGSEGSVPHPWAGQLTVDNLHPLCTDASDSGLTCVRVEWEPGYNWEEIMVQPGAGATLTRAIMEVTSMLDYRRGFTFNLPGMEDKFFRCCDHAVVQDGGPIRAIHTAYTVVAEEEEHLRNMQPIISKHVPGVFYQFVKMVEADIRAAEVAHAVAMELLAEEAEAEAGADCAKGGGGKKGGKKRSKETIRNKARRLEQERVKREREALKEAMRGRAKMIRESVARAQTKIMKVWQKELMTSSSSAPLPPSGWDKVPMGARFPSEMKK